MSGDPKSAFERFLVEKGKVAAAYRMLSGAPKDASDRAVLWSGFSQATRSSVAALVRSAMLDPATKVTGYKIKNWENEDRVFKYLLHMRNAEVHAEHHRDAVPNPIRSHSLEVGRGFAIIEGSGSIHFSNASINGNRVPDGSYTLFKDGRYAIPSNGIATAYTPMHIELIPVTDSSGNQYSFPFDLVPETVPPEVYAMSHVIEKLDEWEREVRRVRSWR